MQTGSRSRWRPAIRRRRRAGQSLVEFALVVPVFVALIGGIVQFGLVFWAQNTLTQTARDTGRWAATQTFACNNSSDVTTAGAAVGVQADQIAKNSSLFGYKSGSFKTVTSGTDDATANNFTTADAMAVAWVKDADTTSEGCPPKDNQAVYHVILRMNLTVPTFFPGMQYLPGLGSCTSSGCAIVLSSTTQFRMEPQP